MSSECEQNFGTISGPLVVIFHFMSSDQSKFLTPSLLIISLFKFYFTYATQLLGGRRADQSVQEQRSEGSAVPAPPAHGDLLDPMGGGRLGHERRARENQLEQGPVLLLLQGLRHRGLPCPGPS